MEEQNWKFSNVFQVEVLDDGVVLAFPWPNQNGQHCAQMFKLDESRSTWDFVREWFFVLSVPDGSRHYFACLNSTKEYILFGLSGSGRNVNDHAVSATVVSTTGDDHGFMDPIQALLEDDRLWHDLQAYPRGGWAVTRLLKRHPSFTILDEGLRVVCEREILGVGFPSLTVDDLGGAILLSGRKGVGAASWPLHFEFENSKEPEKCDVLVPFSDFKLDRWTCTGLQTIRPAIDLLLNQNPAKKTQNSWWFRWSAKERRYMFRANVSRSLGFSPVNLGLDMNNAHLLRSCTFETSTLRTPRETFSPIWKLDGKHQSFPSPGESETLWHSETPTTTNSLTMGCVRRYRPQRNQTLRHRCAKVLAKMALAMLPDEETRKYFVANVLSQQPLPKGLFILPATQDQ